MKRIKLLVWLLFCAVVTSNSILGQTASFDKAVDLSSASSGQTLTYTMNIGCSSLDANCLGAKLIDQLPSDLLFQSAQAILVTSNVDNMNYPISPTYDSGTNTITWDFTTLPDGGMPAGFSATVTLVASIPSGSIPSGAIMTNMASVPTDNAGTPTGSAATTVMASPQWELEKAVTSGAIYHDRPVTYHIRFCPTSTIGNLNLSGVVLTDMIPPGAVFQSATNGGTESGGVVTWNAGSLSVTGGCFEADVIVTYPASDPLNDTGLNNPIPKDNQVNVTGTPVGGGTFTDEAHAMDPLLPPSFALNGYKSSANNGQLTEGQTNYYAISHSNGSTVGVLDYTIVDVLPPQIDMTLLSIGGPSGAMLPISYVVSVELNNSGSYITWQTVTDLSSHDFPVQNSRSNMAMCLPVSAARSIRM
jgi:uncharacterized repeat protein (TIGR01451 family)